jgi:hypothetical protein
MGWAVGAAKALLFEFELLLCSLPQRELVAKQSCSVFARYASRRHSDQGFITVWSGIELPEVVTE